MPADDGLGFHDEENLRPAAPDAAQCGPKQQVKGVQLWARPFPLEDGDLLPRSEDRQCEIATATEANSDGERDCRGRHLDYAVSFRPNCAALKSATSQAAPVPGLVS
jgi:hypothetical protein